MLGTSRFFSLRPHRPMEAVNTLPEALQKRAGSGFIWLDYMDPSEEELAALIEPLGLHPLAIEDCLDEDQVPKMEEFPDHTFILFNRYRCTEGIALIEEVNFFLGKEFLVTVHSHGRPDASLAGRLEAAVQRNLEKARRGPDFLLQVLLDDIVDEKFTAIEGLQDELDELEEEILKGTVDFQPGRLMQLRRRLLLLRKSLVFEREILVKICRRDSPFISEKAIYDFRDIYDHLAKFFEIIEICRELIASIMEIHLSMVSNQMALLGNKTNHVMRRLTMITTVFMPLTLLAGIGGMSEWTMMTGPQNWKIAYPAFLALMGIIAAVSYFLLKWFDARDRFDIAAWWLKPQGQAEEAEFVLKIGASTRR